MRQGRCNTPTPQWLSYLFSMPRSENSAKGCKAEDMACLHLELQGWRILARNQHCRGGEVDVVARDVGGTLCFVEIKSAWKRSAGRPQSRVGNGKQLRVWRAALAYVARHDLPEQEMRFDVLAVRIEDGMQSFELIRNAFQGPSSTFG